jgi:hypothetical protein
MRLPVDTVFTDTTNIIKDLPIRVRFYVRLFGVLGGFPRLHSKFERAMTRREKPHSGNTHRR